MPFDDTDNGEGGGCGPDDPYHNSAVMQGVVNASIEQLTMNCLVNNVCTFHTSLMLLDDLLSANVAALEETIDDGEQGAAADGLSELAQLLMHHVQNLKTQRKRMP